jgi:cell division protein FtsI (penicillin-binding protein 3)/stage V sporulation protein D (sporulation-specific penicillin-binding protein)
MRKAAILRIRIISVMALIVALVFVIRLYVVQIARGEEYKATGERQYVHTVHDLYDRGSIYFTTKNDERVSAATIQSGFVLAIDPTNVEDINGTYERLNAVTAIDRDQFIERANRKDKTYQEIKQTVLKDDADRIEALDLPGVRLYRNQWRYYPGKELAARTIGFVGYDGAERVGKYGLERYYEENLRREDERLSVNFFAEIFANLGDVVFDSGTTKEGDIVTTIEPTVARTLDRVLQSVQDEYESAYTGGIIIDPKTGEIVALGVLPSFDLNDRRDVPIESFQNPLVENVYELGSIIKPLTVAAGIDAGVITSYSTYYDAGFVDLEDRTIRNFDGKGRGTVSMQEVLNQSLNTGVAYITELLGSDRFRKYFYDLKLGSETGIDLPNEGYGLVKNLESPRKVEYATASFGQGIALTPIGAVRALATLANGGVLITPHIAREIAFANGDVHSISYPDGARVFKEETSEEITRMLVNVVDTALRRGTLKKEHYTIAAKTGTAQIADSENGGYYEDRFLHSFFGYFPAYEPRFLIFLYTVEPKEVQYASETLTDPFMELTDFLINYYSIPPDR